MAYLTQFSGSVPVIKFILDQNIMTIGQDFENDICIPEESIADNHASIEVIQNSGSYRFIVKSYEDEPLLNLNGKSIAHAEIQDGDWLVIGDVEFQFTDDGINSIKEMVAQTQATISEAKPAYEMKDTRSPALSLLKELQDDIKEGLQSSTPEKMSTKDFIANSRQSRRRLAI